MQLQLRFFCESSPARSPFLGCVYRYNNTTALSLYSSIPTLYVPDLEAGDVDLGVGWSLPDTCTEHE